MRGQLMELSPANAGIRFNRFLPYWAVLQTDLRQTFRSWVYRLWVLTSVLGACGSLIYRVGVKEEAGIVQTASSQTQNLLRGLVIAGVGLVALIAVSGISSERGSVADAVLSRGISRYQYFLAKWHSRVTVVVGTFLAMGTVILAAYHFFLEPDLTLMGGLTALSLIAAVLAVVVSWGVTIGALANGTVIAITTFWMIIYGGIIALSLVPKPYPSPERMMDALPFVLRGQYDPAAVVQLAIITGTLCLGAAAVGLIGYARKDV